MDGTNDNHYWVKIDADCIFNLKVLCDINKSKTTWITLFNCSSFGIENEKRFKVYSTYGGNNLYILQKNDFYWLQPDGDPEKERKPPPLDPDLILCHN